MSRVSQLNLFTSIRNLEESGEAQFPDRRDSSLDRVPTQEKVATHNEGLQAHCNRPPLQGESEGLDIEMSQKSG